MFQQGVDPGPGLDANTCQLPASSQDVTVVCAHVTENFPPLRSCRLLLSEVPKGRLELTLWRAAFGRHPPLRPVSARLAQRQSARLLTVWSWVRSPHRVRLLLI